jgi:hypothetical protein
MKKYNRKEHRKQLQRERKKAARSGQPVVAYAVLKEARYVSHVPFVVQPWVTMGELVRVVIGPATQKTSATGKGFARKHRFFGASSRVLLNRYDKETRRFEPREKKKEAPETLTGQEFGHRLTATGTVLIPQ